MFNSDHDEYLEELKAEAEQAGFIVTEGEDYGLRHGGEMSVHSDGVRRDTTQGKVKYTLMFPQGVPKDKQLIVRLAKLYTTGGARYGDRNWENSEGEDTLAHHLDALWRHFMTFFFDDDPTEDHAAAIIWNINAVELTRRHIAEHKAEAEAAWPDVQEPAKVPAFNHLEATWDWQEGDSLTEVEPKGGKAGTWLYGKGGDVWCFQDSFGKLQSGVDLSARSLRNLVTEFGPLRVTRGFHYGLILYPDGNAKYDL